MRSTDGEGYFSLQYTIKNHTKKARQMFLRIYRATKMAYEILGSPYLVTSISQLVP